MVGVLQLTGSGAASDAQTDLRALNAAVTGAQLEATLERGCLAVSKAETALDQALRGSSSTGTSVAGSQVQSSFMPIYSMH